MFWRCFGHTQPGIFSAHTAAAALTQLYGEWTLHPLGHSRCCCCPPRALVPCGAVQGHSASARGLTLAPRVTIAAQLGSQLLFSSGCCVQCEQTVSEWGDFLQWSHVKTRNPGLALEGLAVWGRDGDMAWSSQAIGMQPVLCAGVFSCQLSTPSLLQLHGSSLAGSFLSIFLYLSPFFSGSLYTKNIAGIPGGLLLSREDTLFSARSCSARAGGNPFRNVSAGAVGKSPAKCSSHWPGWSL